MVTSSNPLGLQPLPLYFPCGKHMGRKCYPLRVLLLRHKNTRTYSLQVVYFSSSARRDRGGVALRRRGSCTQSHYVSLCLKNTFSQINLSVCNHTPHIFLCAPRVIMLLFVNRCLQNRGVTRLLLLNGLNYKHIDRQ